MELGRRIRRQGAFSHEEVAIMVRFVQRYLQYRRVGFGRTSAFRYAWLVATGGWVMPLPGR